MPRHSEVRNLTFSALQMFDLVLDVVKYPEFLPWCVATRVKSKVYDSKSGDSKSGDGEKGEMVADMAVGFKMIQERYTSRITFETPFHIHITDIGGPFKKLETDWRFVPTADGCEVDFQIDFEFRSALLERVMGGVFADAAHKMMQAFITRAETVYT
ncbi:MAG: type II toxin-antitoxin system RatA family toxin [Magnetovibrio sp.]|nr:type II toxin-antitoxin system RatA family toxin [Magnetovibrio sp.]